MAADDDPQSNDDGPSERSVTMGHTIEMIEERGRISAIGKQGIYN